MNFELTTTSKITTPENSYFIRCHARNASNKHK